MPDHNGVNIAVIAGSIRPGSLNQKLADTYSANLVNRNCRVSQIGLNDYSLPIYDGNLEDDKGVPEKAQKLARQLALQDGLVLISPEYNASVSPLLKNTIDWVSRVKEFDGKPLAPFSGKICAIGAASPGRMGGISAVNHLRDIMTRLGALVIAEMIALPYADNAFDDLGAFNDDGMQAMLENTCNSLIEKTSKLA